MLRRRFTLSTLALLPLAAARPSSLLPAAPGKSFKTSAGEGRGRGHIQLKGINANILDVKVSGQDTSGDLVIFEQTSLSPGRGTPLHVHLAQDEVFYVVDGEYYFQVGDDKYRLRAGDTIFLPRQVPHAWTQVTPRGRMTVTFQPAGRMEEFFLALAALPAEPTPPEIAAIFAAHAMQVVGPPLKVE